MNTTPAQGSPTSRRRDMNREEILDLYQWRQGLCFRHPARGAVETALVKEIQPRLDGKREIRACRECILAMESIRRDAAKEAGAEYVPGRAGEALGGQTAGQDGAES